MWNQTRDVLKPTLFNLVTGNCDPVRSGDLSVNCLLYADDFVLLSESKSGLQFSLNILSTYCSNWKL